MSEHDTDDGWQGALPREHYQEIAEADQELADMIEDVCMPDDDDWDRYQHMAEQDSLEKLLDADDGHDPDEVASGLAVLVAIGLISVGVGLTVSIGAGSITAGILLVGSQLW